jgi:hypothetical protein
MSVLSVLRRGPTTGPLRIVVHGQEGVGKTSWGAAIPDALFLTAEDGGGDLDYTRAVLSTWASLREAVCDLIDDPGEYGTVVIDTINTYERLLGVHLCIKHKVDSLEEIGGGYNKGNLAVMEQMAGLAEDLDVLRLKHGIRVVLLAHSFVKTFNDPLGNPYDRFQIRMHEKSASLWMAWADVVMFAAFEATVKTGSRRNDADNTKKGKAQEGLRRVLYTTKDSAYDAKNRYNLPEELPLSFPAFAHAIRWDQRLAEFKAPADWTIRFRAALDDLGYTWDEVADYLKAKEKPPLDKMEPGARKGLLTHLSKPPGKTDIDAFLGRTAGADPLATP